MNFDAIQFNADGLIPAIAQDVQNGEVLMLAWMNRESLAETLASGDATYFSRSRQQLWKKGESSGHRQKVVALRTDCDSDTLLLLVEQTGPACHTNRHTCFYREWVEGDWCEFLEPEATEEPTEEPDE